MAKLRPNNLLSKRDEERLVETGQRVLLDGGYPNPERVGCPRAKVLKAIALRKMLLSDAGDHIDHLGMCSPCFVEYTAFRRQAERRRLAVYVGIAAVVALVLSMGWWRWRSIHPTAITTRRHIVADLRGRITPRGEQNAEPGRGPLVFERGIDGVTIYLPEGSRAGAYEIAIFREDLGKPLARAAAVATVQKGVATMNATLDLSRVASGRYFLAVRLAGIEWSYYFLVVK